MRMGAPDDIAIFHGGPPRMVRNENGAPGGWFSEQPHKPKRARSCEYGTWRPNGDLHIRAINLWECRMNVDSTTGPFDAAHSKGNLERLPRDILELFPTHNQ